MAPAIRIRETKARAGPGGGLMLVMMFVFFVLLDR